MDIVRKQDIFGIIKPSVDAHTLGIDYISSLLRGCGLTVHLATPAISDTAAYPSRNALVNQLFCWLDNNNINRLCLSYRLDPIDGVGIFHYLVYLLKSRGIFAFQSGLIKKLYFAGLPEACKKIEDAYPELVVVFKDREPDYEVLSRIGIANELLSKSSFTIHPYDKSLNGFGRDVVDKDAHLDLKPVSKGEYKQFGTEQDTLPLRINNSLKNTGLPLIRSHAGPYYQNRKEAVDEFISWVGDIKKSGLIDILSIGTSQLSQSHFGENWGDMANGGGVPVNSIEEYAAIYEAAKPMLVRTYAGTKNIKQLAMIYEKTINIAWHALSFWWFCKLDGRGDNELIENLQQHFNTLEYIEQTGKPFEPNIPHHFAFRGSDDATCILSAYIAAKMAKRLGIKHLVLQYMLNTPRQTWAIQDLAKARAMLTLVRGLEDDRFRVYLQPRAGLDFFSTDLNKARVQLASVTALMDDIEPESIFSPHIIHVVSFTEGSFLARPDSIIESAKITLHALNKYRSYRKSGFIESRPCENEVNDRVKMLTSEVELRIKSIEKTITEPYSPEGLLLIFIAGYLPTPMLWKQRELYPNVVRWNTKFVNGGVRLFNDQGSELLAEELVFWAEENYSRLKQTKQRGAHF